MLSNNKFKAVGISAALATTLGLGLAPAAALAETQAPAKPVDADLVPVVRLLNPYSGEHLFSTDKDEVAHLEALGWTNEGTYWTAPAAPVTEKGNTAASNYQEIKKHGDNEKFMPVYRLYNPYSSDHLYTTDLVEYMARRADGWNGEDVKFMSAALPKQEVKSEVDVKGVDAEGIYRQFNPHTNVGTHNYGGLAENANLLATGNWQADNVDKDGKQQPALYGYDLKKEQDEAYILKSIQRIADCYKEKLKELKGIRDEAIAKIKDGTYKKGMYDEQLKKVSKEAKYYKEQLADVQKYVDHLEQAAQKKIDERINSASKQFSSFYKKLHTNATDALAVLNNLKTVQIPAAVKAVQDAQVALDNGKIVRDSKKAEVDFNQRIYDNAKMNDPKREEYATKLAQSQEDLKKAEKALKDENEATSLPRALSNAQSKLADLKGQAGVAKDKYEAAKKEFRDFRYDQTLPLGQAFRDLVFVEDNKAQIEQLNNALTLMSAVIDGGDYKLGQENKNIAADKTFEAALDTAFKNFDDNTKEITRKIEALQTRDEKQKYYHELLQLKKDASAALDMVNPTDPLQAAADSLGI